MATKKTKTKTKEKTQNRISIEDVLNELLARFDAMGEKIDALSSKVSILSSMVNMERDPGFKTRASVIRKFHPGEDNRPRERKMYKVICAECKQSCEVPFMPKPGRPVYCKPCFTRRKNNRNIETLPNREELVAEISKTLNIDIAQPSKPAKDKPRRTRAKASKAKKTTPRKKTKK